MAVEKQLPFFNYSIDNLAFFRYIKGPFSNKTFCFFITRVK